MVENQHVQLWIEDGIVHGIYKKNCIITLEVAKEIVALRLKLQAGKSYPGIAYMLEGNSVFTPEARKFLAKEGYEGATRVALVTTSLARAVIANVFITIDKPPKPTKLFVSKEKALQWLKKADHPHYAQMN